MRKIFFLSILVISLNSCAQNKIETTITDANGKQIKTENKDLNPNNLDKTIEEFYLNINDASKLDNLISFRFYQKIPYDKFKKLSLEKTEKFGELSNKKIIRKEFSPDRNAVKFVVDVVYKNAITIETLILIKENEKDNFKILEYFYQIKP